MKYLNYKKLVDKYEKYVFLNLERFNIIIIIVKKMCFYNKL